MKTEMFTNQSGSLTTSSAVANIFEQFSIFMLELIFQFRNFILTNVDVAIAVNLAD